MRRLLTAHVDTRHCDASIVSAERVSQRLFGDWNMCARSLAPSDNAILDVLDRRCPFEPHLLTSASGLRLLTSVADIQRRTALTALIV